MRQPCPGMPRRAWEEEGEKCPSLAIGAPSEGRPAVGPAGRPAGRPGPAASGQGMTHIQAGILAGTSAGSQAATCSGVTIRRAESQRGPVARQQAGPPRTGWHARRRVQEFDCLTIKYGVH